MGLLRQDRYASRVNALTGIFVFTTQVEKDLGPDEELRVNALTGIFVFTTQNPRTRMTHEWSMESMP